MPKETEQGRYLPVDLNASHSWEFFVIQIQTLKNEKGSSIDLIDFQAYTESVKLPVLTFTSEKIKVCQMTDNLILNTKYLHFNSGNFKPSRMETNLKRELNMAKNYKEKKSAMVKYLKDTMFTSDIETDETIGILSEKIGTLLIN